MAEEEKIKESGLRSEIESCAFLNVLEAVASSIGWQNSRRDAVEIDHVFEVSVSNHKRMPAFIQGKTVPLEVSMRSMVFPELKNALDMSKVRILG